MDGTRIRRRVLELKFKGDRPWGGPGTAAYEEEKEIWEVGRDWKLFVGRPVEDKDDERRRRRKRRL
jgi:hypothetical protein